MGALAAGQIVLLPFPFSDLSRNKLRPALLLAPAGQGDWIACQITSNPYSDLRAIELIQASFATGSLRRISYIRPGKLFTANETLVASVVGMLKPAALAKARSAVVAMIQASRP